MNYDRLKSELKEGHLRNLYLLYGDEAYLKDALAARIESMAADDAGAEPEKVRFEKGMTPEDLNQAVNTNSFFGNGKFILCVNTGIFREKGKSGGFEELLGNISSGNCIVFSEESVDFKNKLFVEMNKAGYAYKIDLRKSGELSKYIAGRFKKLKKRISYDNINLFIEYSGNSLVDIESDIEKIVTYMGTKSDVKKEYIVNLCSGTRQYKIYEMLDGIFNKNTEKSYNLMRELLDDKIPVQVLLVSIHGRLMELAEVRDAMDRGRDPVVIRNNKQVADFILKLLRRQASKFTLGNLQKSILMAADTDVKIKTGEISGISGIEILVNQLSGV